MDATHERRRQTFDELADRLHAIDDHLGVAYLQARIDLGDESAWAILDRFARLLADTLEERDKAPRRRRPARG